LGWALQIQALFAPLIRSFSFNSKMKMNFHF
jgi:hypothetical protein